jgi:hypothetical protein
VRDGTRRRWLPTEGSTPIARRRAAHDGAHVDPHDHHTDPHDDRGHVTADDPDHADDDATANVSTAVDEPPAALHQHDRIQTAWLRVQVLDRRTGSEQCNKRHDDD